MNLTEKHIINKNHSNFKKFDELCFISKNLYNQANYIIRQEFTANNNYLNYIKIEKITKNLEEHNNYRLLPSQISQQILRLLDKNWLSFFRAIKDWSKNKSKYLGRPKLPKYKKKNGRNIIIFTNQGCRIKDNYIHFPKKLNLTPIKTKVNNLRQVRIVPKNNVYIMEVVYEKDIENLKLNKNKVIAIDLGINNFSTITNNFGLKPTVINGKIIKSFNQYYNKKKAKLMSYVKGLGISNKIIKLTNKRNNKIEDYFHKVSRYIINYCVKNDVGTIVVGKNKNWKQKSKLSKKVNQNFVSIAFDSFINKLNYKAKLLNINFLETEESYTSKSSFIDNETMDKNTNFQGKRIKRGLFKTKNGILINADVNGSYNILRKAFSKFKSDEIEDVGLHPVRINIF